MNDEKYNSLTMKAIGFLDFENKEIRNDIKLDVISHPCRSFTKDYGEGTIIIESYKEYADKVYVLIRTGLSMVDGKMYYSIDQCEPYVEARYPMEVQDLEIEYLEEECICYGICEDLDTGMQILFHLQNIVEYLDCVDDNMLDYTGINIVGVATEGTIVLPIQEDEEDSKRRDTETEYLRIMLQRAKAGDEEALEILEKEEKQTDKQLKERLRNEDFLTIMDGYFLPATEVEAVYAILGTIEEFELLINKETQEEMYWFYLDINGVFMEVIINKRDLVGMPYIGMRFMGTCRVQGSVEFDKVLDGDD